MAKRPQFKAYNHVWLDSAEIRQTSFKCGYCNDKVSSNRGLTVKNTINNRTSPGIAICPECFGPTFIYPHTREYFPSPSFGSSVDHVPSEISELFEEARGCTSSNHFTAAVLLCRKLLMHIAVSLDAKEGESFVKYIDHLASAGYVPPNGKHWVDHIRKKGNEANHEIAIMTAQDAKELLTFLEMLLRFIYEFPNTIPKPAPTLEN